MNFTVYVVSPPDYPHSQCFAEVAETICAGLLDLGHSARVANQPVPGSRHIVLGSNLLPSYPVDVPADSILYNLEQIPSNATWVSSALFALFRRFRVWDYAEENAAALKAWGIEVAALLPVSFHPVLEKMPAVETKDIDVVFVGSMNDRRERVLSDMRGAGLEVVHLFDAYGAKRDAVLARAKVMLNLHFYEAKILEQVRISYYLANGLAVLSERSSNRDVDAEWSAGVCFAAYDGLTAEAVRLCNDHDDRQRLADAGLAFMHDRAIAPRLEAALAATPASMHATATGSSSAAPSSLRRNDPCHCGNGKKFKHCHGAHA